jgi:ferrous iron transport protein B
MKKILLLGNPNVGKSVIFTRLTGTYVVASNYPGTTVEFTKGFMNLKGEKVEVIDVPGIYSLEPVSKAEEVAVDMLKEGDLIINVVDATKLERSLNLTLQLLKQNIPVVIALNLWDEAGHCGIIIDVAKLEKILGVPVVPTCALTGEGMHNLVLRLKEAKANTYLKRDQERWTEIGKIIQQVQKVTHRHHTFLEKLGDASIMPATGIFMAGLVLFLSFQVIRFIGESLINYVFEPAFNILWTPLMLKLSLILNPGSFLHKILIGELFKGEINYTASFGLLTTGLFVPLAMVLPYIFAFYLVLSFMEDSGYLPRLGILVDNIMHTVGLHGLAVVPMFLGLGCNVPGVLATRILEGKRERFIALTLMAIAIPCTAQIALIVGLIGKYGAFGLGIVFGTLFIVWLVLGLLLNLILKGESPEIFVEIPPYRWPYLSVLLKKLWLRTADFILHGVPWVLFGVFLVNILYTFRVIKFIGQITSPVITGVFGLPEETVAALMMGFLRKDIAVGMLLPLNLTMPQSIVACVVLAMYFPCLATFAMMIRELGVKDTVKSIFIMLVAVLIVGTTLNLILSRLS